MARSHMRAVPRTHADQALSSQRLDRLAHHAAPNAEPGFKLRFGRQRRFGRNPLLRNLAAKCRKHAAHRRRLGALVGDFWPRHPYLLLCGGIHLEVFQAKWVPVRDKEIEPPSDSIGTEKGSALALPNTRWLC